MESGGMLHSKWLTNRTFLLLVATEFCSAVVMGPRSRSAGQAATRVQGGFEGLGERGEVDGDGFRRPMQDVRGSGKVAAGALRSGVENRAPTDSVEREKQRGNETGVESETRIYGSFAAEATAAAVAMIEESLMRKRGIPSLDSAPNAGAKQTSEVQDQEEEDMDDDGDAVDDETAKAADSPGLREMKNAALLSKLEPHKLKKKSPCPDVPLCRLRSMQIVRPILKQEDVNEVASSFASSGYSRQAWPFWVSVIGEDLRGAGPLEPEKGDQWDDCWAEVDAKFQEELRQDAEWSFLQGKMLWVWDGNHRLQGWLEVIRNLHPNDLDWHVRVKVEVLDVNESNRMQILQAAHGLNEFIGSGHVQTNALHEIYYVQKVGLGPLEQYASRLSAKDLQECQKKLPPDQGGTWYCLTLNSLVDILAANDIIAESHKAAVRYDKSTPAHNQSEKSRSEAVGKAVATIRKKTGSRLLKLLPVADPRLGEEWLQAIKEGAGKGILKGGGKCNYKLGSEKLYHIAVAKVPAHAKTEWVRLGTGDEAERLRRGYPKPVPTEIDFIEWVGRETWWWQVEDQAARLVAEFENQEVGPLVKLAVGTTAAQPLGQWLEGWKCKYYKLLFGEQLKRADKKASLSQQEGGALAAKRIAFRYVKYLLEKGFADREPVGLAEFRSDDSELTMYDDNQRQSMSLWEAENCPWWLDMFKPPDEEKHLYEDHKAGHLRVASSERTREEKEVAVQAAKEAAAKAEARRMQELGPVKNLKRKAQRRKREQYEKVEGSQGEQSDCSQIRKRRKPGRTIKIQGYVAREAGEAAPEDGAEGWMQSSDGHRPWANSSRQADSMCRNLHLPQKLPGKHVVAEVVCAAVDYVELATQLEQHQRVKAARIQAENRGEKAAGSSSHSGRELPLPAVWFELVHFLTRNAGGRVPKCGGVQRKWAAEMVLCDVPTGHPVPGCSADLATVPSWNKFSHEQIPRCIQLARAILSDNGCLVMVAQSTVDTCVEIHRHVQSNKMKIAKTWTVIQEQPLDHDQGQEKKTCMVHCVVRKDCKFDFRQLVRPMDPDFDPVTTDVLRSLVPPWDHTKRRETDGAPQFLWRGGREKAQSLWQQLIECCTVEGDRVVDLTAGTGGAMVAAEISGRHLYAMERDEELVHEVLFHLQRRPQEMLPGPSSPSSGSEVSRPYVLDPSYF